MIGLLAFFNLKKPELAFFPFFGAMLGVFTLYSLLQDGTVAVAYNSGAPITWSDYPLYFIPMTLILAQITLALLQAFRRL